MLRRLPEIVRTSSRLDATSAAVVTLLAQLGVPAKRANVCEALQIHPGFPGLGSVRDTLAEWGVTARPGRVQPSKLAHIPLPALVLLTENDNARLVVIEQVEGEVVRYADPSRGRVREKLDDLVRHFEGVVVTARAPQRSRRRARDFERREERLASLRIPALVLAVSISLAAGAVLLTKASVVSIGLALVELLGLGLCLLLVGHELRGAHPLWRRLCPSGPIVNCTVVLRSPASRLAGVVPLVDLGVVYFGARLLTLFSCLLPGTPQVAGPVLLVESIGALALAVFLLFQQAFVLRRWCLPCLGLHGLLWLELLLLVGVGVGVGIGVDDGTPTTPDGWVPVLLAHTVVAGCWIALRPLLGSARGAPAMRRELRRLTARPASFRALLAEAPPIVSDAMPGSLTVGRADAPWHLIVISKPFCDACADAHETLEAMLAHHPGRLRVSFCFTSGPDAANEVAARLLSYASQDTEGAGRALSDWFAGDMDVDAWIVRNPLPASVDLAEGHRLLESQQRVIEQLGVEGTPAFVLGNRLVPARCGLREINLLIQDGEQEVAREAA